MIPWIQVYTNLPSHRKTCRLRDALALKSNYEAVGLLICFWSWAAVNAVGGNLSGYSARDISDAAGYKKSPDKFLNALVASGFVDKTEDGFAIHDWEEHAALLMDSNEQQKKNTRDRVRRYRERRKGNVESVGNGACNVTSNASNAPTLPNLTLPNQTITKADAFVTDSACDLSVTELFDEFWAAYPKQFGKEDAQEVWDEMVKYRNVAEQIIQSVERWKDSEQWLEKGGRFIPRAAKFLREGYWKTAPVEEAPKGRKLDDDEIAAVRRMLEEDEE